MLIFRVNMVLTVEISNQSTDSTGCLIVSECRLGKWS